MSRPWQEGFQPDPRAQGAYSQAGRRPSQTKVHYVSTATRLQHGTLKRDVFDAALLDGDHLPLRADGGLDTDRVIAGLDDKLCTIVQSRRLLCASYDAAIDAQGLDPLLKTRGAFHALDFGALVGSLLPVWSPAPAHVTADGPFAPLHSARRHPFAFRPAVLATVSDDNKKGDQGEIVAQCVTVTPRLFNFPIGDDRRLVMGCCNDVFGDTCAWVLITHAYDPPLPYAQLNKESKNKPRRPDDHPYERVFRWEAYMLRHPEANDISSFGLLDTKQTGKDVVRAMVSWSVTECAAILSELRRAGLDTYLVQMPMRLTQDEVASRDRPKGGMDLRRMLLVELLLRGTPLEGMWTGQPVRLCAAGRCSPLLSRCFGRGDM